MAMMLLASSIGTYAQSCCCTGAGSNYSILPNLNKHVVGLRYTQRSYFAKTRSINPDLNGQITNQYMNSMELFGRFNVHKRLQLSVFIPVNIIAQKTNNTTTRAAGLGDMSLLLQYNVLNPMLCTGKVTKHQLRLGIGTKLPTGEFKMDANDLFSTNLQLGTGSIDFLANAIYTLRYKSFGFNATASYKVNTPNTREYRFGDRTQAGVSMFYIFEVKDVQIMPTAGVNYEHQFENRFKKRVLDYTGGDFINVSAGLDIYYKQFAFSSSVSPAVMNRLNWYGENRNRFNIEAGIFYNFTITNKTKPTT
ncbi:MAG: hypothetical protein RLZZ367_109 [Bacteroidota bacterium]